MLEQQIAQLLSNTQVTNLIILEWNVRNLTKIECQKLYYNETAENYTTMKRQKIILQWNGRKLYYNEMSENLKLICLSIMCGILVLRASKLGFRLFHFFDNKIVCLGFHVDNTMSVVFLL